MDPIPFIDWNGSGGIDPDDIALTLAMAEAAEEEAEEAFPDREDADGAEDAESDCRRTMLLLSD
jgi:hypothetical protein